MTGEDDALRRLPDDIVRNARVCRDLLQTMETLREATFSQSNCFYSCNCEDRNNY